MSSEDIILKWKNPDLRQNNNIIHPCGKGFQEMDKSEMSGICGGSDDVHPETTTLCAASVSAVLSLPGSYLVTAVWCKKD
jgi:type 2 lantibiotic (TIGR03893 family)